MPPDYKIIVERAAHTSQVLPLIHEGVSEMWQDQVSPTPYLAFPVDVRDRVIYIETLEGEPVGVVCFRLLGPGGSGPEGHVSLLYVEPSSRRLGLAAALWAAMLKELAGLGALTVRVFVAASNVGAVSTARTVGALEAVRVFEQDVPEVQR